MHRFDPLAPETRGDARPAPTPRSVLLGSAPACDDPYGRWSGMPGEYGPERRTRHERTKGDGHQGR